MSKWDVWDVVKIVLPSIFTGIIGYMFSTLRGKYRHELKWVLLEKKSLLDIAEEIVSEISVGYKKTEIKNLTKYRFVLHNSGRTPIQQKDVVDNVKWKGPGRILRARVGESNPPVPLEIDFEEDIAKDNRIVEIKWSLFNQKCMALIEILCDAGETESRGTISGQILNIPKIKEKDYSKRHGDIFSSSGLMDINWTHSFRGNLAVVGKRSLAVISGIGSVMVPTIAMEYLIRFNGISEWAILLGPSSGMILYFVAVKIITRNPYSKLASSARQSLASTP